MNNIKTKKTTQKEFFDESNIKLNIDSDDDSDNCEDIDDEDIDFDNNVKVDITSKSVKSTYTEFLERKNKLLLAPEYQRDFCWSLDKMNAFIDTIMRGQIVPNYVIYNLCSKEKKNIKLNVLMANIV